VFKHPAAFALNKRRRIERNRQEAIMAAQLTPRQAETILNDHSLAIDAYDIGRITTLAVLIQPGQPVEASLRIIEDYLRRLHKLTRQANDAATRLRTLN
jgi:hypothetical protein